MKIVIRTDASQQIGSGHVMRCLTLAEALRDYEVAIEFITRDYEYIMSRGFKVKWALYNMKTEFF